jgi:hypothetical protein
MKHAVRATAYRTARFFFLANFSAKRLQASNLVKIFFVQAYGSLFLIFPMQFYSLQVVYKTLLILELAMPAARLLAVALLPSSLNWA